MYIRSTKTIYLVKKSNLEVFLGYSTSYIPGENFFYYKDPWVRGFTTDLEKYYYNGFMYFLCFNPRLWNIENIVDSTSLFKCLICGIYIITI